MKFSWILCSRYGDIIFYTLSKHLSVEYNGIEKGEKVVGQESIESKLKNATTLIACCGCTFHR